MYVYYLTMKNGTTISVRVPPRGFMKRMKTKEIPVLVHALKPMDPEFCGSEVIHDPESFRRRPDEIDANRWSGVL